MDGKQWEKLVKLIEQIDLSYALSHLRHTPSEHTLKLKEKLKKQLESLDEQDLKTLYVYYIIGESYASKTPSKELLLNRVAVASKNYARSITMEKLLRKENLEPVLLRGKYLIDLTKKG